MTANSGNAKRLKWVRENLRRPDGRPVERQALSRALGWPDQRWKNLEGALPWGPNSAQWVREGLLALAARTTLPEDAGQRLVAYVFGETTKKPWASPPEWKPGQCPEPRRPGRPKKSPAPMLLDPRTRFASDPVRRAMQPPIYGSRGGGAARRVQLVAILNALGAGQLDQGTALDAITRIYDPVESYYYDKQPPDRA